MQLSLSSPWPGVRVIGDALPLNWTFLNRSNQPIAFVWEGCCRQNGSLQILRNQQPVKPIEPTTALAHMFAKPEIVQPGQSATFDTRLSDWVVIKQEGQYEIKGTYTGVLPTQKPPLRLPISLWKDTATSSSVRMDLLTPTDYLKQRDSFTKSSGLLIQLDTRWARPKNPKTKEAPEQASNLDPIELAVRLTNKGTNTLNLTWPGDFQIWHTAPNGQRVAGIPTSLNTEHQKIALLPGGSFTNAFPPELYPLEGEPFGSYQIFIDLPPTKERPQRAPSNTIDYKWNLSARDIHRLIGFCAGQPARNPHLKLLRVHLLDIATQLPLIKEDLFIDPDAKSLLKELKEAALLKPLLPQPGEFVLPLNLKDNELTISDPNIAEVFNKLAPALDAQLDKLIDNRRHLGWRLKAVITHSGDTDAALLENIAKELSSKSRYLKVE